MAFHPYPKLIRALFNVNRFGPPAPVTAPSAWPGVDHKVSRPPPATPCPIRTRFRSGCGPQGPSPRRRRATRRLIMQKARRHPFQGSDRLRARGFRYCFTPLLGVLFTFPSRYLSTIGLPGVLSLGGWCRRIRTGFLRPRPTQVPARVRTHSPYGAVTRSGPPFQACSAMSPSSSRRRPYNPARASTPAVWAGPLSLAATRGVTVVFLSSDDWDVSVRRVRLHA